jgi:aminomethyltransferase
VLDRGIARSGYEIASNGNVVGYVTSGMPAPTLEKNIGLGYVPPELAKIGTEFDILIRSKPTRARVVKTPFYANRARGK